MPRQADMTVVRHVGTQPIYADLSHYPDEIAAKKSLQRDRNQKTAQRKRDGVATERKPRAAKSTPAAKSTTGAATAKPRVRIIPDEAKPLYARQESERAAHYDAEKAMNERHAAELQQIDRLIEAINMADSIDPALSVALRERLATYQ